MIPLKIRIERARLRIVQKKNSRKGFNTRGKEKGTSIPFTRIGNKDFGCPFRGKDTFSGQWKKFNDRAFLTTKDDKSTVIEVLPYATNKYL